MPRHPRVFVPGFPLHIVQRGHDRQPVFVESEDYEFYLCNFAEIKAELSIRLHAYCLMTNHLHLIVTPDLDGGSISKLMRVVAARQTRRVNKLEMRTGTLWEGRFKASLIDTEQYLLACYRYIELNPVRAAIVTEPEDYRWSSYRCHAAMATNPILDAHETYDALGKSRAERALAYRRFVSDGVSKTELSLIRAAVQRNQLTGGKQFQEAIERRTGHRVHSRGRGRPPTARDEGGQASNPK